MTQNTHGGHDVIVPGGYRLILEPGSAILGLPEIELTRAIDVSMPAGAQVVYLGYDGYYNVGKEDILSVSIAGTEIEPSAWREMKRSEYAPQCSPYSPRSTMMLLDDCSWAFKLTNPLPADTVITVRWRERRILYNPLMVKAVRAVYPSNTLDTSVPWKERAAVEAGNPVPPMPNVTGLLFEGIPENYQVEIWRSVLNRRRVSGTPRIPRGRHWRPYRRFVPEDGRLALHEAECVGDGGKAFVGARLYNPVSGARSEIMPAAFIHKQEVTTFVL